MQRNSFNMYFEGSAQLELVRSEFLPSGTDRPFVVIRGKTSGSFKQYGSFQWTSGVRAVCAAFLRFALSELPSSLDYCLVGSKGSLAASLDYALSKGPAWVGEMFGATPGGGLYAKRIFRVTNPNRKRPGPVALSVNTTVFAASDLKIFLNEKRVVEHDALLAILQSIEGQGGGINGQDRGASS